MNNYGWIIALVAALTALVSVVIGPLVSLRIAKRQIIASTVTLSRQAWVDKLRDALVEFLSKSTMLIGLARNQYTDQDLIHRIEEVYRLAYKIELLTNPREEDHSKLVKLTDEITSSLGKSKSKDFDLKILDEKERRIVEISQKILKHEWERVKKGENH